MSRLKTAAPPVLAALLLVNILSFSSCHTVYKSTRQEVPGSLGVSSEIPADSASERMIRPYRQRLNQEMNEVIGTAPVELSKNPLESSLGNFVTDLMLAEARLQTTKAVDLAVTTNGGLRNPIPQGQVTVGHVFELMPFENELGLVTLPGTTVQQLFDFAAAKRTVPIGNATYNIQGGRAFDIKIGGQPFDAQKSYTVVISDYLAGGGDNMAFMKEAKFEPLGLTVRAAILRHIRSLTAQHKPIVAQVEGRVRVIE